jgi:hypothetical protein
MMPSGYEELDLKVYVDYSQERQNSLNPFVFATDGTQISSASLNNCIIDPVTLSVFGLPLPMTAEWKTTFNGNYARFQKSDFTFANAIKWKNFDVLGNGVALSQCDTIKAVGGISTVADQQLSKVLHKLFQVLGRHGAPSFLELVVQRLSH